MAFMLHGIGTMEYGKRDFWPDGSFVTTQWFVILFIPILPLVSKRVSFTGSPNYVTYDTSGKYVYDPSVLNVKQVLSMYGWLGSLIGTIVMMGALDDIISKKGGDADMAVGLCLGCLPIILALPYVLRRRAKKRMAQEWERERLGFPSGG